MRVGKTSGGNLIFSGLTVNDARACGCGHAAVTVSRLWLYRYVSTLAFKLKTVDEKFHVLVIVQPVTQLGQYVIAFGVLEFTGISHTDQAILTVVEHTALLNVPAQKIVPAALLTADPVAHFVTLAIGVHVVVTGHAGRHRLGNLTAVGPASYKIDDATRRTQAVLSTGTVDYFDTFDHIQIDGVAVPRAVPQWIALRHTVHQEQG